MNTEDRSWRETPHYERKNEPTEAMVAEGVRVLKRAGHLFLPAGIPRRWLEHAVVETWKAMQRVSMNGH